MTGNSLDDDCPLPVNVQHRNVACFAVFWCVYYLAAPVSYVGLTHANLLKALENSDTISNLPSAMYLWLTVVPVVVAWTLPQPRYLKPLAMVSIGLMAAITVAVALTLWMGISSKVTTWVVVAHGASFGAANGVLITALWDLLRRGVATKRRGQALGYAFGIGPLFACVGAIIQDALFDGKLLGGRSFGLKFPDNYMALFAGVAPLLLVAAATVSIFTVRAASQAGDESEDANRSQTWAEIAAGIGQFVQNRSVLFAVLIYVIVYSGGNAIFSNVSLHAKSLLGEDTDTLGLQSFLRFGFKAAAGGLLGWLLARASPRATLIATTSVLLFGMVWALTSTGWAFMVTFGLLGAGELFGAYFPNYVATASAKKFVRLNMAYLGVLSTLIGFSSLAFGMISDRFGRIASFYTAAAMLVLALVLIGLLLPARPTPH